MQAEFCGWGRVACLAGERAPQRWDGAAAELWPSPRTPPDSVRTGPRWWSRGTTRLVPWHVAFDAKTKPASCGEEQVSLPSRLRCVAWVGGWKSALCRRVGVTQGVAAWGRVPERSRGYKGQPRCRTWSSEGLSSSGSIRAVPGEGREGAFCESRRARLPESRSP